MDNKAVKEELIELEASAAGGVPRCKPSCPDRLAEATISRYFSELCWKSWAEVRPGREGNLAR